MYAYILSCYFFEIEATRQSSIINYSWNLVKKRKEFGIKSLGSVHLAWLRSYFLHPKKGGSRVCSA